MGRTINNRNLPHPKPVEKIELSDKNPRRRLAAVIFFLALGAAALVYALMSYLSKGDGWTQIEADSAAETNCADEFVFLYCLGQSGMSATAENKALVSVYTQAAVNAYRLFQNDVGFDGLNNVYAINRHVNETLEVDEALYNAFELFDRSGSRALYLAPVYSRYDNIFYCNDDSELSNFDPYTNPEVSKEYAEMAEWAGDSGAVQLQLLGNNQVRLFVSEEYLDYAQQEGIEDFIDFYWMKNAFIVDYLADTLIAHGYSLGSISSYDGFARNLDDSGNTYSFTIYDRREKTIYPAAVMEYSGRKSIVYLRDYMMNAMDFQHYYETADGQVRTVYLDETDGLCKSALDSLVCYSENKGCAEVMLHIMPIYIADTFNAEELAVFHKNGIASVYCEENIIYHTDERIMLTNFYSDGEVVYDASQK